MRGKNDRIINKNQIISAVIAADIILRKSISVWINILKNL